MTLVRPNVDQLRRNVPTTLQQARQWVLWKYSRDGRKPPIGADGRAINGTDPDTWMWLSDVLASVQNDPDQLNGIGVALPRTGREGYNNFVPLLAVDIDWKHCADGESGKFPRHLMNLVTELDSYTEFSPSGKGAHVLIAAKLPGVKGVRKHSFPDGSEVSLMQRGAYATFTGHKLPESGTTIQGRQFQIDSILSEWFPKDAAAPEYADGLAGSDCPCGAVGSAAPEIEIDLNARVSEEEIRQLIAGVNRTPDQKRRMAATWEMRRTPGVLNAEFVFKGDHSVSMYLMSIIREVVFLAPRMGWISPDQKVADFAVTFARKHGIPAEGVNAPRLLAWLADARRYRQAPRGSSPGSVQNPSMNLNAEDTNDTNSESTPPHTVQCSLCCDLGDLAKGHPDQLQANGITRLISEREGLAGNTSTDHESVTKRRRQLGPSQSAVQATVAQRKGWVLLKTLAADLPQLSPKALLMTLGRLVKQGKLEHRAGRSGRYRIKRERKARRPRKRVARPFPLTKDGRERKTVSRSELVRRGWSKDLIDDLLARKGRDFIVQRLPKPGTQRTFMDARYYWVTLVKEMEAEPSFEDKRFELRRKQSQAANSPSSVSGRATPGAQHDHLRP
jgi:hypothetical protein